MPIPVMLLRAKHFNWLGTTGVAVVYFGLYLGAIWLAWRAFRHVWNNPRGWLTKADWKLIGYSQLEIFAAEIGIGIMGQVLHLSSASENNQIIYRLLSSNSVVLILFSIGIVFLTPILEELVFRGYLIRGVMSWAPVWLSIITSGIVFSAGHASSNWLSFLIYAVMGMILARAYVKTNRIQASIALHFINNLFATVMMVITIVGDLH
ncbi:CPBP family intramembrane metalloprotease [Fructilactobacillus myrtifloralis]|uniref:CPBP family intramembrane metalloprotease n=1 Tax=Fructilactobacillus myrtifloralis TaxID=2940301 RepID=A0ABY5BRB0_9LACO|nr:type II CAAX endopeptidase family protein [Fructilactobacillus myrtifloralis]USS85446.1 CPBP family intramembrane metalloprotease [Fructilactobacillus myrtifloralis]